MDRTAARRYTTAELKRAAHDRGFEITPRLISDWVSLGLLDKGIDRGRGQGRGKTYTWSHDQRELLMTLLIYRDHTPPVSRPTLANIPVAVWLIWGDELVPLRQVRRALQTWAGRHERTGWTQAQATAQAVLKQMDHPDADPSDRTRLVDAVAQAAYTGTVDTQQLDALVRRVFDPNDTGLTRGPMGIMKAGDYANITGARATALAALQTAPDAAYTAARAQYQHVGSTPPAQLLKLNQRTISAAALGATTRPFDQVVNNACLDLITILGYVLKADTQ